MTDTTITKSVILTAPRETVWQYLTDRKKLGDWFFEAEADLKTGQDYALFEIGRASCRERVFRAV